MRWLLGATSALSSGSGQHRPEPGSCRGRAVDDEGHRELRRIGQPVEIANAIRFLASDDADYITGTTLHIDGGVTARTSGLTPHADGGSRIIGIRDSATNRPGPQDVLICMTDTDMRTDEPCPP